MNFTSRTPNHSDEFRTAVVFVFSKTGELLLEQDFAVKLPPPPVSKSETPPAETPPVEGSSDGDPLKSLEDILPVY
jgi:hypothetical protein